jgi:hypothetical protein
MDARKHAAYVPVVPVPFRLVGSISPFALPRQGELTTFYDCLNDKYWRERLDKSAFSNARRLRMDTSQYG